jgi:DNA-binding NtrC family response regulator
MFIGYGSNIQEIQEFLEGRNSIALFAQSTEEAIHILDEKDVSTVVLSIHQLNDAAILKYINQYYPEKEVIISASREYNEIIDLLSKGHFTVMQQPMKLKDLAAMLF